MVVVINNTEMEINEAIAYMMDKRNSTTNTEERKDIDCDIRMLLNIKNKNNVSRGTYFKVPEYIKIKKGVANYD